MNKILTLDQAAEIANQLNKQGKKIVLAGGCFDILHIGHLMFLEKAKEAGNILFILLESDERIRKMKGSKRPINTQSDRAHLLSALGIVDYVVLLPLLETNEEYDKVILSIKPAIIATTKHDPDRTHKERQGNLIGSRVVDVVERIANKSTSRLTAILSEDL